MSDETRESIRLAQQLTEARKAETEATKELARAQRELDTAVRKGVTNTAALEEKELKLRNALEERTKATEALIKKQEDLKEVQEELAARADLLAAGVDKLKKSYEGALSVVDQTYDLNLSMYNGFVNQEIAVRKYATTVQSFHVDLRRGTGFTKRYTNQFEKLKSAAADLGITQERLSEIQMGLHSEFSAFDSLSETQRDNIVKLGMTYSNLGLSAEDTAKIFEQLHFSLGITGDAAVVTSQDMKKLAKETGQSFQKVAQSFADLGPELARFGSEGSRVFDALTKRARTLGMTTKDAFDIADSLDTFQGAAEIVGRMNAQFGMQLNSVELMKASHEERIEILRDEFQLQGRSFQGLHRRQKQMLASILGRDVGTVAKLFGQEMDIKAFQEDVDKPTRQEDFIKLSDQYAGMAQQFSEIWLDKKGGIRKLIKQQREELGFIDRNMEGLSGLQRGLGLATLGAAGIGTTYMGVKGINALRSGGARGMLKTLASGKKGLITGALGLLSSGAMKGTASAGGASMLRAGLPGFSRLSSGASPATNLVRQSGLTQSASGAATKGAIDAGAKGAGKGLLKGLAKGLPFVGLALGLASSADRASRGDYSGAAMELGLGALSMVPGVGFAASAMGHMALSQRHAMVDQEAATPDTQAMPHSQITPVDAAAAATVPAEIIVKELVVKSTIELEGTPLKTYINETVNQKLAVQRP